MKTYRLLAMLLGCLYGVMLGFAETAHAETFYLQSRISEIGTTGDYMKVYRLNPSTSDEEEIRIEIEPGTLFHRVQSIRNFNVGDVVSVSGDFNDFEKAWVARVIEPPHAGLN